jgi:phage gp29-like protein
LQRPAGDLQSVSEARVAAPNDSAPSIARILRPQNGGWQWLMPQMAAVTPQYLEAVLRGAAQGNHAQQAALFRMMLDTWPELAACVQELAYAVARLKIIVEPFAEEDDQASDDAVARQKLVSGALRTMRPDAASDENELEGTIRDLVTGWIAGVSVLEIDWHLARTTGLGSFRGPRATWWAEPTSYGLGADGRLGLRPDGGGQFPAFSPRSSATIVPFPDHKFLIGIHKAQSGVPFGSALLRPLAWWWCAANFSADWLLNLAQIFGLPFRWANYDPTAPQETVDRICGMLQNMGSAGWAAFPAGTTLELKDAGKTGDHSPQGELLDRADRYARLLILGQTQSGGKGSALGGQSFGEVESGVKDQRIDAAGRYVCRVLNTQLVPSILTLNFGDDSECPTVRMLEDEEGSLEEAQRDQILAQIMPLSKSFLRKKYGQPEPQDDEDEAGGAPEPQQDVSKPGTMPENKSTKAAKMDGSMKAMRGKACGHLSAQLAEIAEIADDEEMLAALKAHAARAVAAKAAPTSDVHIHLPEVPPLPVPEPAAPALPPVIHLNVSLPPAGGKETITFTKDLETGKISGCVKHTEPAE